VELFELLDVPPVQGPALGAEQDGCEDDSTIDFHLCFQGYTMFAPQSVLELYSFVQPPLLLHLPETSLCRTSRRSVGRSLGSIAFVIYP